MYSSVHTMHHLQKVGQFIPQRIDKFFLFYEPCSCLSMAVRQLYYSFHEQLYQIKSSDLFYYWNRTVMGSCCNLSLQSTRWTFQENQALANCLTLKFKFAQVFDFLSVQIGLADLSSFADLLINTLRYLNIGLLFIRNFILLLYNRAIQ